MSWVEVHTGDDELEAESGVLSNGVKRGAHEAELGAGSRNKADASLYRGRSYHGAQQSFDWKTSNRTRLPAQGLTSPMLRDHDVRSKPLSFAF